MQVESRRAIAFEKTVAGAQCAERTLRSGCDPWYVPYMPALTPLPYVTVQTLSAFDMIDSMGVNTNIAYQNGGTDAADLPNRDGERELIAALRRLGIHHIRNQGLDRNPAENAGTAHPGAPSDLQNFVTLRQAVPGLMLDYVVDAGGPPHWGDGDVSDQTAVLLSLARMGALASIEGPNEPNNQATYSPAGRRYSTALGAYNAIWTQWGQALDALKASDAAFGSVDLLPPTSAVQGGDFPDGVEETYENARLTDHSAQYTLMNLHSYGPFAGLSQGDPQGDVTAGNPPNWGAYQVSIPNWGRYGMPGRGVVVSESGADTVLSGGGGLPVSERAQGVALVSDFFWAKYYGARRFYIYQINDDSSDLTDANAPRWGIYRGNWSAKPAATYIHNFTSILADAAQSDPAAIPAFTVTGPKVATWGATMAFSKSDGSAVLACNNVLPWWNVATGADIVPRAEAWSVRFAKPVTYTVTDVVRGVTSAAATGMVVRIGVRGVPVLIHILKVTP
jgi:hypothetical protein